MTLRRAATADFAFIRSLTSNPAYAPFIGDDDEAQLSLWSTSQTERILIWELNEKPSGFAIFREIGNPSGRVELFRLALGQTDRGQGASFVAALIDYGFGPLNASGIWLDASSENARAHQVYLRAGFVQEGRLRAHWYRPILGRSVDLVLYGMQREEWQRRVEPHRP